MALGGLDIGTSSVKFVLYNSTGEELASSVKGYRLYKENGYEYEPGEIWEAIKCVIRHCSGQVGEEISSIGISSMGESFVCFDGNDNILGRAMMYLDPRGFEECRYLSEKIGADTIRRIAGSKPNEQFSIMKLMWLRKHTEYYKAVSKVLLFEDFAGYMLTGKRQISESLASRTLAFDIHNREWSESIFDAAGIDINLMSPVAPAGSIIGTVLPDLAKELGLSERTLIVNGGHDQFCAPVGCGILDPSICSNGMGSSDALHILLEERLKNDFANHYDFSEAPYLTPSVYVTFGSVLASGSMLRWYQETFEQAMTVRVKGKGMRFYDYMESIMGNEPSGLICIPAFSGTGTPIYSTDTKGMIYGLQLNTSEGQIYRSLLEGVAYAQLMNITVLEDQGIHFSGIHATGGGSLSSVWMQIRADILDKEISVVGKNACARAGAILGAVAVGLYDSVESAMKSMVRIGTTYYPNQKRRSLYMEHYQKFQQLLRDNHYPV